MECFPNMLMNLVINDPECAVKVMKENDKEIAQLKERIQELEKTLYLYTGLKG